MLRLNKQPNILIFMTDHQRGDTVLPENGAIMPNIQNMASEGLTFSETYCPTAHCCPARATFFSGLYPSRSGVWNNVGNDMALSRSLNDGVRLFSEDLKDAGYNLGYSGKWHVSAEENPSDRGWEELFVKAKTSSNADKRDPWDRIKEIEKTAEKERGYGEILMNGYGSHTLFFENNKHNKDEKAVENGIEAIKKYGKEDKPWAVFVGASMPHAPYRVPQKYLDMYELDDIKLPNSYSDRMEDKPNYYSKLREMRFDQLSEKEVKDAIRHFWAMCTYLDDLFGKLLDTLEKTGQEDDTLVLFCSDHGDYVGDHGLFHKGVPAFKGAYHVPAVLKWPKGIKNSGRVVDEFVSLADFAPTFTELAGLEPDDKLTGKSLVEFLDDDEPEEWRDTMFTQCNGVENYFTQRSVFTKEFKYVFNGFDYDELYDLRNDPDEVNNLQDDPEYDEIKKELVKKMWRFAYEQDDPLGRVKYITVATAPWGPGLAFMD